MKLSDARDSYYQNTGTLSELTRKMSYSGIAVIWLIKTNKDLASAYESWWIWIIGGFVLALTCDILQYVFLAVSWGLFNHHKHQQGVELDDDIEAPSYLNNGGLFFFITKVVIVIVTTFFLLCALTKIIA
ncbi:MAG: hypothetical protein ACSHX7_04885 [Luteolibacter sp.]